MKEQLRTTLALAILAATLPSQGNDYDKALQRAELIERQEGNLAAAEAAYTALLDDSKAPRSVHDAAYFQLAQLMWRLGKRDEATQMLDVVVEKGGELGEQAKALLQSGSKEAQGQQDKVAQAHAIIKRYAEVQGTSQNATTMSELEKELRSLGRAAAQAITEELNVGPALRNNGAQLSAGAQPQLAFLVSQLWVIGTEPAVKFFSDAAKTGPLPWQRFLTSRAGWVAKDLVPTHLLFAQTVDPTREVWRNVTSRLSRLTTDAIGTALASNHEATREAGIAALQNRWAIMAGDKRAAFLYDHAAKLRNMFAADSSALHAVKWGLLGEMVERGPSDATKLLLEEIAKHPGDYPSVRGKTAGVAGDDEWIRAAANAARAIAANGTPETEPAKTTILRLLFNHEPQWTKAAVDDIATLIKLGYLHKSDHSPWLKRYVTMASTAQLKELIAQFPQMWDVASTSLQIAQERATPELLPAVATVLSQCDTTVSWMDLNRNTQTVYYVVLLAAACDQERCGAIVSEFALAHPRHIGSTAGILASLSLEQNDSHARAALRKLLLSDQYGTGPTARTVRNFIFAELVRAGDVAAIPLFEKAYALGLQPGGRNYASLKPNAQHHYPPTRGAAGLGLLARNSSYNRHFWHGYDDNDLASIWQMLLNGPQSDAAWADLRESNTTAPAPAAHVFAEQVAARWSKLSRNERDNLANSFRAFSYLSDDALDKNTALRGAIAELVGDPDDNLAIAVFRQLPSAIAKQFTDQAMAGLKRGKTQNWLYVISSQGIKLEKAAWLAALAGDRTMRRAALEGLRKGVDPTLRSAIEAQLDHEDGSVRMSACSALVRLFSVDAVPALLPLMQDSNSAVVKHTRELLNQLRELEEQRDFWGNKNGGNITKTSSAAKLIAQAMPKEDKEQRLLAIRSLALLNAPEALPYLIDWTKDKDADVQAAARKAITAMHKKGEAEGSKQK